MYMCGWTDPEATLMFYHDDGEWISHLFVQPKDTLMEIWEGRRPGTEGALRDWPIDRADSSHDMFHLLASPRIIGACPCRPGLTLASILS